MTSLRLPFRTHAGHYLLALLSLVLWFDSVKRLDGPLQFDEYDLLATASRPGYVLSRQLGSTAWNHYLPLLVTYGVVRMPGVSNTRVASRVPPVILGTLLLIGLNLFAHLYLNSLGAGFLGLLLYCNGHFAYQLGSNRGYVWGMLAVGVVVAGLLALTRQPQSPRNRWLWGAIGLASTAAFFSHFFAGLTCTLLVGAYFFPVAARRARPHWPVVAGVLVGLLVAGFRLAHALQKSGRLQLPTLAHFPDPLQGLFYSFGGGTRIGNLFPIGLVVGTWIYVWKRERLKSFWQPFVLLTLVLFTLIPVAASFDALEPRYYLPLFLPLVLWVTFALGPREATRLSGLPHFLLLLALTGTVWVAAAHRSETVKGYTQQMGAFPQLCEKGSALLQKVPRGCLQIEGKMNRSRFFRLACLSIPEDLPRAEECAERYTIRVDVPPSTVAAPELVWRNRAGEIIRHH